MRLDNSAIAAGITNAAVLNKLRKKLSKRYKEELENEVEDTQVAALPGAAESTDTDGDGVATALDRFAALR